MSDRIQIDYTALQGDDFFKVSEQHTEYVRNQVQRLHISNDRTSGEAAVFGLIAHKNLLLSSVNMDESDFKSFYALYVNTRNMMKDFGVEFAQIDERMAAAVGKE